MILRAIAVCPDVQLAQTLEDALASMAGLRLGRTLKHYPTAPELSKMVRNVAAQVVFLSFQRHDVASALAKRLMEEIPGIQIVAVHEESNPELLLDIMRSGLREFLAYPFERTAIMESLTHVKDMLERRPVDVSGTGQLISFLPARAGVGTSTLALNMSAAWARRAGEKVLLADFDLNSGMIRFFLNLNSEYSVTDAIGRAHDMDESLWPPMVARWGNLDVLHAGALNPHVRIDAAHISDLIAFLRRTYSLMAFDLSGNLERYSLEIMRESKHIIVVCTTEYASLHMAREKIHFLKKHDLGSRVKLVVNRVANNSILDGAQVEEVLGEPVAVALPNDYNAVMRAIGGGRCVESSSELGKQVARFADTIASSAGYSYTPGGKRKFLEMFNVAANVTALARRVR